MQNASEHQIDTEKQPWVAPSLTLISTENTEGKPFSPSESLGFGPS